MSDGDSVAPDRLTAVLRAAALVSADLSLLRVLRHVATAARELVDARLAVLVETGVDGVVQSASAPVTIGDEQRWRDALDRLAADAPLRAVTLDGHPATAGLAHPHPFTGHHVGVPIVVHQRTFGHLHVIADRPFAELDVTLLGALADGAATAVENALLYEDAERRRRWQAISTEATQDLFAGGGDGERLERVLQHALRGAQADLALFARAVDDSAVRVSAVVGAFDDKVRGQLITLDGSVAEPVLRDGKPVLIEDYSSLDGQAEPEVRSCIGSVMLVPLWSGARIEGAVAVGRLTGRPRFDDSELDHFAGFAGHAGIALELDRARADREALRLVRDHDRIAGDLHDHVIQQLFVTGMGLQSLAMRLERPADRDRLLGHAERLDTTIRRIRTTIYRLTEQRPADGLQARLRAVLRETEPLLGFRAELDLAGPLDDRVPALLAEKAVSLVREALTGAAEHGAARHARVVASVEQHQLCVEVSDDGAEPGTPARESALAGMRSRSGQGGTLVLDTPPGGGCRVRWTVAV